MKTLQYKPAEDLTEALTSSMDCLRMAQKLFADTGLHVCADAMRQQADRNLDLLIKAAGPT